MSTRMLFAVGMLMIAVAAEPVLKENDPLQVDTTWKGQFTQQGTHPDQRFPPELQATLTVTKRDGDNVELELRETCEGLDITFLCRGRVTRNADMSLALEFSSHGVKGNPTASFYLVDVPYCAKIRGDTIKGTWKYAEKGSGIDLSGDYALARE